LIMTILTLGLLLVLAALFARVDIATKALFGWLSRAREWRGLGASWLDA